MTAWILRACTLATIAFMASAIGLSLPESAHAAGGDIKIIVGMTTSEVTLTYHPWPCGTDYWHCDEGNHSSNTGLDMSNALGATGGASVYFQAFVASGYAYAVIQNHQYGTSYCPGADVAVWIPYPDSSQGTWIGYIDFVQVNVSQSFGTSFYVSGYGYSVQAIGSVVSGRGTGSCISDASHLHQSGTPNSPYMWTNWGADADDDAGKGGVQINPTSDNSSNWLHWITY